MTAEALIGNDFRFQRGDGGSPEAFTDLCAVISPGEIGEEKTLLDITTLCSNAREYRGGLADGLEIPLEMNFKDGEPGARALYNDYKNNVTRNFKLAVIAGSPSESFAFAAAIRGWKLGVKVGEKATVTFTLKITGAVTWSF